MKSYSLFSILLLCLAILIVDALAFYWLQSITKLFSSSTLKIAINILFWTFTIGLVVGIIILKVILDDINPRRKHLLISSLYGLTVSSFIPKIVFVIVISILFYANQAFSETESAVIIPIVGLLAGLLPFAVILYGIFKAVYRFKIIHHKLHFKKLPEAFHGLKIVQISDLHIGSFNYKYDILEKAVRLINSLHPDVIVFTGDLVNNYAWELIGWDKVLNKLKASKGKYAVLGNHDYGDYSKWDNDKDKHENFNDIQNFFKKIDFTLLMDESENLETNNQRIAIIGVQNWGTPPFKQYGDLQKAMKNTEHIPFKILLSHNPTHWSEEVLDNTDIALTLSGHTHGMQFGVNYKNKTWSPIKYKYKHWEGLYMHHEQFLYVNKGLGWLGFPGRLGMRPEITWFELYSK